MKSFTGIIALALLAALSGCDQRVDQTLIARANIPSPGAASLWLSESNDCGTKPISAGWYRDGLWIFRLSSTRGGVGAVTQELTLCAKDAAGQATKVWHSLHGGGAPLLVISCVAGEKNSCAMYQDGYDPGAWSDDAE